MVFYLYIYSHILVTVVKDFIEQDQHSKRTLDNSLQEQKYLSHLFFPIALKSGIILVRSFGKLNQKTNLKRKFSVSSDRLRLHFSHLNEHKLRHNFRATIDPMCSCGLEPETTLYYLLRCNLYSDFRTELLNDICALNPTLKKLSHEKLLNILLCGSEDFSFKTNKKIIKSTIKFLKTSECFIGPLF